MELYELGEFVERISTMESFLTALAAEEEYLLSRGLHRAHQIEGYEQSAKATQSFPADFASLKRIMPRIDRQLSADLQSLDAEAKLVENVSLVQFRLKLLMLRKPMTFGQALLNQTAFYLPYVSRLFQSKSLFRAEDVSLQRTIVNLGRLRGIVVVAKELVSWRTYGDDEVLKPSNISTDRVSDLIDSALREIEQITSLSPAQRERVVEYLREAKNEVSSKRPSWSKVIGAVVIAATVVSGIADAPVAKKLLQDTIEYILGTSVEKPLENFIPPPSKREQLPVSEIA